MATSPFKTPPPGSASLGSAVPLPAEYQVLNTLDNPNAGIEKYLDDQYQKTGHIPPGFEAEVGHLVKDEPSFLFRHPWLFPLMGVTAGLGLAATPLGAATSTLGPATAANMAATEGVVGGSSVPSSIAAGGAASTAGASTLSKILNSPLTGLATSAGLGALQSMFAPRPNSFADGSESDPRSILKKGVDSASGLFGDLSSQLKRGVDLPDAKVAEPPSFSGPSLPMSFGVQAPPANLQKGYHLDGPGGPQTAPGGALMGAGGLAAQLGGTAAPGTTQPQDDTSKAMAAFKLLGVNS